MPAAMKPLGQARPADTTAVTLYALPNSGIDARGRAKVRTIVVCNTTGSAATYRLFLDKDGTTYDEASALVWDTSLAANTTTWISGLDLSLDSTSAGFGVRSGTGNAITFTIFGEEENF